MKNAEFVTFGGGGLDRSAHLRSEPVTMDELWQNGGQVLMLWQGKPLLRGSDQQGVSQALAWIASDHLLVADQRAQAVFLGLGAAQQGLFAVNLEGWQPGATGENQIGLFDDLSVQRHPNLPSSAGFAELRQVMSLLTPFDAEAASTAKAILAWHASHGFCAKCGAASQMVDAGWQRRCDTCQTSHFPRTDPVVIMLITKGDRVLIGRSPGWPEGMYSLLAGFVEPGETLEAAVRREVLEETGVRVAEVGYLASQPWAFPMSLMFGCYGHAISEDISVDPQEIEDAQWVTRQDMMDIQADLHPTIRPARKGAIARFLLDNWLADTLD